MQSLPEPESLPPERDSLPPEPESMLHVRLRRLAACAAISAETIELTPPELLSNRGPMVGVTSSRLGHQPQRQRQICQFLSRRMLDLRNTDACVLIAAGSAIESLATRAAELFNVPYVKLSTAHQEPVHSTTHRACLARVTNSSKLSRDELLIWLADQVDALYVRRGGKVAACLQQRLSVLGDTSTRVAIFNDKPNAASDLIAAGAIGWYLIRDQQTSNAEQRDSVHRIDAEMLQDAAAISETNDAWIRTQGQWLIHCTRACSGAWPGQTQRQYQDELLLGDTQSTKRTPHDSLARIVQSGQLIANAITSARAFPVVCFSAASLVDCLQRRKFRQHVCRWDYEPYGVAIHIDAAKRLGLQPVIYGDPNNRSQLAQQDQYRFQATGQTYDWTLEQEWRSCRSIDLTELSTDEVRIFLPHAWQRSRLKPILPWPVTVLGQKANVGQQAVNRQ